MWQIQRQTCPFHFHRTEMHLRGQTVWTLYSVGTSGNLGALHYTTGQEWMSDNEDRTSLCFSSAMNFKHPNAVFCCDSFSVINRRELETNALSCFSGLLFASLCVCVCVLLLLYLCGNFLLSKQHLEGFLPSEMHSFRLVFLFFVLGLSLN